LTTANALQLGGVPKHQALYRRARQGASAHGYSEFCFSGRVLGHKTVDNTANEPGNRSFYRCDSVSIRPARCKAELTEAGPRLSRATLSVRAAPPLRSAAEAHCELGHIHAPRPAAVRETIRTPGGWTAIRCRSAASARRRHPTHVRIMTRVGRCSAIVQQTRIRFRRLAARPVRQFLG
jgi:hypothetical protein